MSRAGPDGLADAASVQVCIDYEPRGPDVIKLRHSWLQVGLAVCVRSMLTRACHV